MVPIAAFLGKSPSTSFTNKLWIDFFRIFFQDDLPCLDPSPVMFVFLHSFQYHLTVPTRGVVMEDSHVRLNLPVGLQSTDGANDEIIANQLLLIVIREILRLRGVVPLYLRTAGDLMLLVEVGHHLGSQPGLEATEITVQTILLVVS